MNSALWNYKWAWGLCPALIEMSPVLRSYSRGAGLVSEELSPGTPSLESVLIKASHRLSAAYGLSLLDSPALSPSQSCAADCVLLSDRPHRTTPDPWRTPDEVTSNACRSGTRRGNGGCYFDVTGASYGRVRD